MNVLFLSAAGVDDLDGQSIYGDLLKVFHSHGHAVFIVSPQEKRDKRETSFSVEHGISHLKVLTGNLQKCGMIEKGISQIRMRKQFLKAVDKYFGDISFDLILYPTPPTTLAPTIGLLKQKTGAHSYLLLKDIFPQNSLDLGILSQNGIKGMLFRYFKRTEHETYAVSDYIGCMSEANYSYLKKHEPWIDVNRLEINPNSFTPLEHQIIDKSTLRSALDLPEDKKIFVYGGNLGRPQGIDFLIEVLRENELSPAGFFLITGTGTERQKLENFFSEENPQYAKLLSSLPRKAFDTLLLACDIGMIVLDYRFTIPNFPSRLLSYMQASLPIITATDASTDVGIVAEENGFGVRAFSNDAYDFLEICREMTQMDLDGMGCRARQYLESNFTAEQTYKIIMEHFDGN